MSQIDYAFHLQLKQAAELHQAGRYFEANELYEHLNTEFPEQPELLNLFGILKQQMGELTVAEMLFRKAIAIRPSASMLCNLGITLDALNKLEDAVSYLTAAIHLKSDYPVACFNLGNVYQKLNKLSEAEGCFDRAIKTNPNYVDAYFNLGNLHKARGNLEQAVLHYQEAISRRHNFAEAHFNLGLIYQQQGLPETAIAQFRQALTSKPNFATAHSSLIFTMDMHPHITTAQKQSERKLWADLHAPPTITCGAFQNNKEISRVLRVGYVSADFRKHSAACIFGPMLTDYNASEFEIFAYSNNDMEDTYTKAIRQQVNCFRSIYGHSDADVANLIRADEIDILVDLSGHSQGNRLGVFAYKPAPIQITAWGYVGGSGLKAMDVLFADPIVAPREERHLYSEKLVDLPCIAGYFPLEELPPIKALPAIKNQHIVFGAFNRLAKVTSCTFELWSGVLKSIPESTLLIKTPELESNCERSRVINSFAKFGISSQRIQLAGKTSWKDHIAAYNNVDISLDPLPHCGGVTSLESLIMGVPVLTIKGATLTERLTSSFLTLLGMENWIANSQEEYLELALRHASNRAALQKHRAELRNKMESTYLGSKTLFVSTVECNYRSLWAEWCVNE